MHKNVADIRDAKTGATLAIVYVDKNKQLMFTSTGNVIKLPFKPLMGESANDYSVRNMSNFNRIEGLIRSHISGGSMSVGGYRFDFVPMDSMCSTSIHYIMVWESMSPIRRN